MALPADTKALVAVDLGAQSCRVSLLQWSDHEPNVTVVHRFANGPVATPSGLRWDIENIWQGVQEGLRLCGLRAKEGIRSIGVDGWAVDYVRLRPDGSASEAPYCYRDERTLRVEKRVHELIPPSRLYSLTGIQVLNINTLYQLYADKKAGRDAAPWLNLPEYLTHRLGGERVAEYTNATHTGLLRLGKPEWCEEIFETLELDRGATARIVMSGSLVGELQGNLRKMEAYRGTLLLVPACHDTASAIAAIPASGDDWAFISSGTWSLVGTVLSQPCAKDGARQANFTNLGGVGGTTCFLKNVNGMWLLSECIKEWNARGSSWSVANLLRACESQPAPNHLLNVDDPDLFLPGRMLEKINAQLDGSGKPCDTFRERVAIATVVLHSLAKRYAEVLSLVAEITGKRLRRLFVVGGGSQNALLNRLTAERTGLEVIAGSVESTTLGNFAIQLAALEDSTTEGRGVRSEDVAKWAAILNSAPFGSCEAHGAN